MISIIYSTLDIASTNMAHAMIQRHGFSKDGDAWRHGNIEIREINSPLVHAEFLDDLKTDILVMLSKHSSAAGIAAFTTHSTGNWGNEAKLGGTPKHLSKAAPLHMLAVLRSLSKISAEGMQAVYEATHHGPLLKTPSLFVELGGNKETVENTSLAEKEADAVMQALEAAESGAAEYSKVVIGIGGTHYPSKFSMLAIQKGYAFSHIMPKYAIFNPDGSNNLDMLDQAATLSTNAPEAAIIEWKSINAATRNIIIAKLEKIGMQYEKI